MIIRPQRKNSTEMRMTIQIEVNIFISQKRDLLSFVSIYHGCIKINCKYNQYSIMYLHFHLIFPYFVADKEK